MPISVETSSAPAMWTINYKIKKNMNFKILTQILKWDGE
jgi:hypothetical protein